MPHIHIVVRRGDGSEEPVQFDAPSGTEQSLQNFALNENLKIGGACAGMGLCMTCRVKILSDANALPRLTRAEKEFRERNLLAADERLACQFSPEADLTCAIEK